MDAASTAAPIPDLVRAGERLAFLRKPAESDRLDRLSGWHIILAARPATLALALGDPP